MASFVERINMIYVRSRFKWRKLSTTKACQRMWFHSQFNWKLIKIWLRSLAVSWTVNNEDAMTIEAEYYYGKYEYKIRTTKNLQINM